MRWIIKHRVLVIVAFITIILVIVMSMSYLYDYRTTGPEKKVGNIITLFQEPFVKAGNGLSKGLSGILKFRTILNENEALKEEVSSLKKEIVDLKLKRVDLERMTHLADVLNETFNEYIGTHITADVIAKDGSNWFNTFTINAGLEDGVEEDAVIVNGHGLIGRVFEVGDNWSKVLAIVDDSNSVSFKILRNTKYIGIISGDGNGGLDGYLLDPDADVLVGDEIITSGLGMFPEGISIGTVEEVIKDENNLLKTVAVEPYVYFRNIDKVLVFNY